MSMTKEVERLIDRYVDEIEGNLPRRQRTDIAAEIRSLLEDRLEDMAQTEGRDPDEQMVTVVLKELGPPDDVAASYGPPQYLIGPRMYYVFLVTVFAVLVALGISFLIGFGFSFANTSLSVADFFKTFGNFFSIYVGAAFRALGVIVLVFAVLERISVVSEWWGKGKDRKPLNEIPFLSRLGIGDRVGDWDPTSLRDIPKPDRISRGEIYLEIGFLLVWLILFNFFPHWVVILNPAEFFFGFLPLLAPTFRVYLLWWNLYWALSLVLNYVLLRQGRWTRFTRWVNLGLMIFSGIIAYTMLVGPPVLGITPAYAEHHGISQEAIRSAEGSVIPILTRIFNIGLVLHLIVKGFNLLKNGWSLLRRPGDLVIAVKEESI